MAKLYKELNEHVIEQDAGTYQDGITEELYAAVQVGLGENDVFGEYEARRKTDTEGHNEGHDIWLNSKPAQMHRLLLQDVVKCYVI